LNKKARSVSFPATVNMPQGIVEYALVHTSGKVHESVFKTEADPFQIHLARLLVGPNEPASRAADAKTPPELAGPRITISVQWTVNGARKEMPIESTVSNTITRARMTLGDWVYNGSRVVQGTFLAHRDGSIVSVISDPDALINNPRPGRDD